jgi:KaiC/GvpD/RAD55 family RecA-like ATPase
MNHLDRQGILKAALLQGRYGAKKTGKTIAFRCPRHNDSHASAWLGDYQWGCAACGFTEHFDTLADLLHVTLPETKGKGSTGLTLVEYAERKGLSLESLRSVGVTEKVGKFGDTLLAIPYYDGEGKLLRTKLRTRKGTFWDKDGEGAPLYGQDRLAKAPAGQAVLLVEGESDCHAAWQRGVLAVGLPGASQWRPEYTSLIGNRPVIVWQEPDEGGATLVAAVAKSLPKATVLQQVKLDPSPEAPVIKDFGDLHQAVQQVGGDFQSLWRGILSTAIPIGAEGPAVAFDSISGDTLRVMLDEKLQPIDAIPTMLPMWNSCCGGNGGGIGLGRGWFITIGANTGTGKSLIGLNLAAQAILRGEVVCFLSLEMGRSELATRLMAILSGESVRQLEQGPNFDSNAYHRAAQYMDEIRQSTGGHVLVNRKPLSKLTDVLQCMQFYHETQGCRYVVMDYLQLAWTSGQHSIHERMEEVAHRMREQTATIGCTTIALSQFNRQTSANRAERPVAQSLMGGSAIENDSHQVLLFDHSRFERVGSSANTWLILDKNRHGGVKDIPVRWDYTTLRLEPRVAEPVPESTPKFTSYGSGRGSYDR